jgi:hypothetical protein
MIVYIFLLSALCAHGVHASYVAATAGRIVADDAARIAATQVDDVGRTVARGADSSAGLAAGQALESGVQAGGTTVAREVEREVVSAQAQANKTVLQVIQDTAQSMYKWVFGTPVDIAPVSTPVIKVAAPAAQSAGLANDLAQAPALQMQRSQDDVARAGGTQTNIAKHALGPDHETVNPILEEAAKKGLESAVEMQKKALQSQIAKSQTTKAVATGANAQKDQDDA